MKIFDVVRARVDLGQPARCIRRGVVPELLALTRLELRQLAARVAVLPQVLVDQRELELRLEIVDWRNISNITHVTLFLTA